MSAASTSQITGSSMKKNRPTSLVVVSIDVTSTGTIGLAKALAIGLAMPSAVACRTEKMLRLEIQPRISSFQREIT